MERCAGDGEGSAKAAGNSSNGGPRGQRLRNRQVKNFLTLTLLATGAPMLLMGDEVRRTQRGNNNAFYQDKDRVTLLGWFLLANLRAWVELSAQREASLAECPK